MNVLYKIFVKIGVFFDGLIRRKEVFSKSIHCIEKNIDVVVEIIEAHISVSFELYHHEKYIDLLWADLMFESPHSNNFHRIPTF